MNITEQGYVTTEQSPNGVTTITFFHPNHNSLPSRLLRALAEAFDQVGKEEAVKVVILCSAEHKTFQDTLPNVAQPVNLHLHLPPKRAAVYAHQSHHNHPLACDE